MFRSNLATYPNGAAELGYAENLAQAARSFIGALFAVKPVRSTAAELPKASVRQKAATVRKLYQMAASYDSISPSLAAELRNLAGRD